MLYNDDFTSKTWDNQNFNVYCLIYNYLKSGYSIREIQTLLTHFDIQMTEEQIKQFSSFEYLLYKTLL
jgi:hypothetical protein